MLRIIAFKLLYLKTSVKGGAPTQMSKHFAIFNTMYLMHILCKKATTKYNV